MEYTAPKGERTLVFDAVASSVAEPIRFSARTLDGEAAAGTVEVERRRLVGTTTETLPLRPQNLFEKPRFCLRYRVYVMPEEDAMIYLESTRVETSTIIWVLAGLAILAGGVALFPYLIDLIGAL